MRFKKWVNVTLTIIMIISIVFGSAEHPNTWGYLGIQLLASLMAVCSGYLLIRYGWLRGE